MLRSARHGNTVPRRRFVLAVAMAAGAAMAVTGLATGASATDRGGSGGGDHRGSQSQPSTQRGGEESVGLYVYLKKDPTQRAYWQNSTQQYLVRAWEGDEYGGVTLEEAQTAVDAAGLKVCGPGAWGVQQDKVYGGVEIFTESPAPNYPKSWFGWVDAGGPIYEAAHWNLDDFFAVPECAAAPPAPSPSATATPSTPTSSTPTPSVTVPAVPVPPADAPTPEPAVTPVPTPVVTVAPAPQPAETSTAVPSAAPSPTASATSAVVTAVLPAPSSVETKAPAVVTQVLAAEPAGASLAQTGAAPIAGAVAAVLLVAGGGVLLLLRRRSATR